MNALVYFETDRGIHREKSKVARKEKRKKLHGLYYSKNMANFEAFHMISLGNLLKHKPLISEELGVIGKLETLI